MQKLVETIINLQLYEMILIIPILIIFYFLIGFYLEQLNNQIYHKSTIWAWIPFARIILASKLTINSLIGWIILFLYVLTSNYSFTFENHIITKTVPSELFSDISFIILSFFVIGLYIYVIFKSIVLRKEELLKEQKIEVQNSNNTNEVLQKISLEDNLVNNTNEAVMQDLGNTIIVPTMTFNEDNQENNSKKIELETEDVALTNDTNIQNDEELNKQTIEAIEALKKLQV